MQEPKPIALWASCDILAGERRGSRGRGKEGMGSVSGRLSPEERTRTPTEEIVARIWAKELRLPYIGLDDDFIDLGSHSLQGVAISARLEERFGVSIPVRILFEEPTVADLAAWIDRQRGATRQPPGRDHPASSKAVDCGQSSLCPAGGVAFVPCTRWPNWHARPIHVDPSLPFTAIHLSQQIRRRTCGFRPWPAT